MTTCEYTDATRFPLTTWRGMDARAQVMNDACSLETLRMYRSQWNHMTRLQRDRLAELETKAVHWASVREQLSE